MRDDSTSGERGGDLKRLKRWLFNLTAAMSAMLAVAMMMLWAATYWCEIDLSYGTKPDSQRMHEVYTVSAAFSSIDLNYVHTLLRSDGVLGLKLHLFEGKYLPPSQWTDGLWFSYFSFPQNMSNKLREDNLKSLVGSSRSCR
jgi:hypothetical protein